MTIKHLFNIIFLASGLLIAYGLISATTGDRKTQTIVKPHQKICGITLVAPPREIDSSAFVKLKSLGTDMIALVPYGFTRSGEGSVIFDTQRQWWGERSEGIESCIKMTRDQGISVMLKPQVWTHDGWIGELDFETEAQWASWEKDYQAYIMTFVDIAVKHEVEIFCLGTEINKSVEKRPQFWSNMIKEIRSKYKGKLTYSANWDHYEKVPFWSELDYVGISSYFPLSDKSLPSSAELCKSWKKVIKKLNRYSSKTQKPILFTEYGYLSVDGCAGKTWELENNLDKLTLNQQAQANAYEALWTSLHDEPTWSGGFLWKWYPQGQGHEGYLHKDYTPQGKMAENVLKKWFLEQH